VPPPDRNDPLLAAVVSALAGVRSNQRVLVIGEAPLLCRALSAAARCDLVPKGPADVVVALSAPDVPEAVAQTLPGGRVVAVAANLAAAQRTADLHGLALQHHEQVSGAVAWSARRRAQGLA